ncbi:MAG: UDP-3-O-acyl-N-acetylglucosamine deacetylase [Rhodospirillaceae bacterium]|nr:UDP-3-O-acyl-N-acetylglucosamine deacetylase [Rhodospirillaceae bacterium]MBT4118642.1 UDP-3-O-acyl-N-acetylglucosamine deacetylase [Rhodospirillaceae bacterium]MBT6292208.1 UDP-3-O-acyl-N-acetylglucosamine deacetylase [Rhodospirillaceae bacterium]
MNHLGPNHTAGLNSNTSNKSLVDLAMENFAVQRTLSRPASCTGIALHSGRKISLSINPAPAGAGIQFRRTDLAGSAPIAANWENVVDTTMCTTLGGEGDVRIATVEHLMAALAGCHVDNAIIEVDGPELPVMDGSAHPFVFLIECAGVIEQNVSRPILEILKPVKVSAGASSAELAPADIFSVSFEIDFDQSAVSRQEISVNLVNGTFKNEIARARTFGFANEVEQLRAAGLALGGSLDNAVVVDGETVLNEGGLRYSDEFVRHKVLDAVGDLYLAGAPIKGHYRGVRAGHALTNKLLHTLFADTGAWRIRNGDAQLDPIAATG